MREKKGYKMKREEMMMILKELLDEEEAQRVQATTEPDRFRHIMVKIGIRTALARLLERWKDERLLGRWGGEEDEA